MHGNEYMVTNQGYHLDHKSDVYLRVICGMHKLA